MVDIKSKGANLGSALLYPKDRGWLLIIRNSNPTDSHPAISIDSVDVSYLEIVLWDPGAKPPDDELLLFRGFQFDPNQFDKKKKAKADDG